MPRPTKEKIHIIEKRNELVWALSYQGYDGEEIGTIFNLDRSSIKRIIDKRPSGWKPKWQKVALEE